MAGFKSAFAAARKSGKSVFTWNGKRYNTKLKEETSKPKSKKSSLPKSGVPLPKSRDDAVSGMSKKPSFSGMSDVAMNKKTSHPGFPGMRGASDVFKGTVKKSSTDSKKKGHIGAMKNASTKMTPKRNKADLDIGSRKY